MLAAATGTLAAAEIASNAAVMMFGGIETSEGMTTTLFWHLLTNPDQLAALRADRSLGANAVEESLRLEPAAARVDRYATDDVELAGATIRRGDLVIVSLTAANRDPATYPDPDRFDLARPNARAHLAFAQGPHACVGLHLARLETLSALDAALDGWPDLRLDRGATPRPASSSGSRGRCPSAGPPADDTSVHRTRRAGRASSSALGSGGVGCRRSARDAGQRPTGTNRTAHQGRISKGSDHDSDPSSRRRARRRRTFPRECLLVERRFDRAFDRAFGGSDRGTDDRTVGGSVDRAVGVRLRLRHRPPPSSCRTPSRPPASSCGAST